MLQLRQITIQQFKNYDYITLSLSPQINCFSGPNGSGKTNVLDALYYLSFTKSYFSLPDSQLVKHGHEWHRVEGLYLRNVLEESVSLFWQNGKKILRTNNNDVKKLSEHIGNYPLVMIAPGDIQLIHEGSEERRKFMDGIIAQTDKQYLRNLLDYNRVLEQRNRMLKQYAEGGVLDPDLLESYNAQIIKLGSAIYSGRVSFLNEFIPLFQHYYQLISEAKEVVGIEHISDYHDNTPAACIEQSKQADMAATRTTKGIHKDDLEFTIHHYPLKKMGSQGQQKSFIIALKLAQFEYLRQITQVKPLLLLDDIFEKLDGNRLAVIMQMIAQDNFGQIFITDTHQSRIQSSFEGLPVQVKYFAVNNGSIVEI